jgi:integrase
VAKPDERDRRPTDDELAKLIAHWSPNPRQSIPMIDLTLFAVSTAMRLGEIVGLRWENLDEANRTIIIRERKHPTKKTTNHQKVPLPFGTCTVGGQLIDPLQIMLKQPSAWSRKGRIFPHAAQSVSRAFQRATDGTAIVDLRFHDLRHGCGATRSLGPKIFTADNRTQRPAARWCRSARSASRLERTASPRQVRFRGEPEGKPAGSVENDPKPNWVSRNHRLTIP